MYSIHNEGKSVIAERFIRVLKNKIYKHMAAVPKNVYIDKLDDIVNEYSNTYRTIKMKPVDVKSTNYVEYNVNSNEKDPRNFQVGDHVRISKYKNIFAEGYTPNWSEEVFIIEKSYKHSSTLLMISMVKKLLELFMKTNYKKQTKKDLG